jgi:hypothetical protein
MLKILLYGVYGLVSIPFIVGLAWVCWELFEDALMSFFLPILIRITRPKRK